MITKHSTLMGSDGMIYVIGGVNYFENDTPLHISWYYNPISSYYGTINNNGFNYRAIGHSAFNLL